MSNTSSGTGVSAERLKMAAEELAACEKRLRYSSSCLASDISRLKGSNTVQHEYVKRLEMQQEILESDIEKTKMMVSVLARIADEAELTENTVLDHEDSLTSMKEKIEVRDLSLVSELISEVMKQQ